VTETIKEKSANLWTETQEKVHELNNQVQENLDLGWQKVMETTETSGTLHELGARVGLVQPTMTEEIKFGAEKMGTAGPTATLHEVTETVKEKGEQVWTGTQEKVQGLSDSVKENLEWGRKKVMVATETPGPLHEVGARVGLVQPTMAEEIKFGAEKMGTAGPTATLHEIGAQIQENVAVGTETAKELTETVKEKGAQVWTDTQDKVQEMTENVKEKGAQVWTGTQEKVQEMTENVKEIGAQVWTGTQEKVQGLSDSVKENIEFGKMKVMEATEAPGPLHELGARVGLVQPTMTEEIKFEAEKLGTAGYTTKLQEIEVKTKENVSVDKEPVKRLHVHVHDLEKEKLKEVTTPIVIEEIEVEKRGSV